MREITLIGFPTPLNNVKRIGLFTANATPSFIDPLATVIIARGVDTRIVNPLSVGEVAGLGV